MVVATATEVTAMPEMATVAVMAVASQAGIMATITEMAMGMATVMAVVKAMAVAAVVAMWAAVVWVVIAASAGMLR